MHEEALFRDLRRELVQALLREGGGRVVEVRVWVGALSHVGSDRLTDSWPRIVEGTPAEGSRLVVVPSEDVRNPLAGSVVLSSFTVDDEGAPR
jgi:hydrogenase nickel incorporation protein HypA/HybF